jgi:DNA damage-binding protein 1
LVPGSNHFGHIQALFLAKTDSNDIIVGDLMKSVSLLRIDSEKNLVELARDYTPAWTTAVEAIDDEIIIAAESSYNIYSLNYLQDSTAEKERQKLEIRGVFHVGEFINKFRKGMIQPSEDCHRLV